MRIFSRGKVISKEANNNIYRTVWVGRKSALAKSTENSMLEGRDLKLREGKSEVNESKTQSHETLRVLETNCMTPCRIC